MNRTIGRGSTQRQWALKGKIAEERGLLQRRTHRTMEGGLQKGAPAGADSCRLKGAAYCFGCHTGTACLLRATADGPCCSRQRLLTRCWAGAGVPRCGTAELVAAQLI